MKQIVTLHHKQIAYVSYDPEERSLTVIYHRGESKRHDHVDSASFQSLLEGSNKVDALSQLLSRLLPQHVTDNTGQYCVK